MGGKNMKLVLLGAPGAGKGTQAKIISDTYSINQVSTGDMFREAIRHGTEMGTKAKHFIDQGKLVPDDIVIGIVDERLRQPDVSSGYILDGFPRTLAQARALDNIQKLDSVVYIDVDFGVLLERLTGRRSCPDCGAVYHVINNPPQAEGKCDKCSAGLVQREDDNEETLKSRLATFEEMTSPLISHYEDMGLLKRIVIEGKGDIQQTADMIKKYLDTLK
jgi:adenylate kinase